MKSNKLFCLLVMGVVFLRPAFAEETKNSIVVSNAWVRLVPPIQKNTAAYMVIENSSDKEVLLKSVSADVARVAEMHKMEDANGMMKMQYLENISIPSKGKIELHPSGYHLMLIDLAKPLSKNQIVMISLNFSNGQKIVVNARVDEEKD